MNKYDGIQEFKTITAENPGYFDELIESYIGNGWVIVRLFSTKDDLFGAQLAKVKELQPWK